jgi:hypothetical protein
MENQSSPKKKRNLKLSWNGRKRVMYLNFERPWVRPVLSLIMPGNLQAMYDINPSQSSLKKRWEANRKFREKGLEAEFAKVRNRL